MLKLDNKDISRSYVFIANFEHVSHLALVFLLLTLSRLMSAEMCGTNLNLFQKLVKVSWDGVRRTLPSDTFNLPHIES